VENRAAVDNALANVAAGAPTKPSRARRREEIVASYWQRYCAKTDTIGFIGPLAWGRFDDDGPALHARSGVLVRERAVHLESWGVQALAEVIDPDLPVAAGRMPSANCGWRWRLAPTATPVSPRSTASRPRATAWRPRRPRRCAVPSTHSTPRSSS